MSCAQRPVPIFPLPNCVVLPGVLQALHIFEPRYRRMVADELSRPPTDRWVAMALLRSGYEPTYYTHHAPIHPALCLCAILKHQPLPDGRSNILVQGKCRATVKEEKHDASYRCAVLQAEPTVQDLLPEDEDELRTKLAQRLQQLPERLLRMSCEFTARENTLECVVDMITYHVLGPETAPAKQLILAEPRVDFRAKMLITLLERQCTAKPAPCGPSLWPPVTSDN